MATVTVDSTLSRVSTLLQDPTNIRWPLTELLNWLNDGQREVVLRKPNASVKNLPLQLIAGTKQSIPQDGVQLLEVVRNLPGAAIRICDREILDSQSPNWHISNQSSQVQHYCYTEKDLKNFYVFPPNNGAGVVELVYSAAPANATLGGVISVDDIYQSALVDFVMYRAFSKDSEYSADPARVATHFNAFESSLGGRSRMEVAANPNLADSPNPNLPTRK